MQSQVARLYNPLFGYVKKRVYSKEDAEDLAQDMFLKVSKSNNDGVDTLAGYMSLPKIRLPIIIEKKNSYQQIPLKMIRFSIR